MASEIRVNTFKNRSGLGTITVNDTGANFSGVVTATSGFSGDLTGNVTGNATGLSGSPTLSGITSISTTNLTVNGNAYPATGPLSNRNLIINGDFRINQRGGSNTTINTYALDRWRSYGGPMGFTISQQDVLSSLETSRYALRFQRTSGNTQTNNTGVAQGIESKNCEGLAGTQLTLSFKARRGANLSGDFAYIVFFGTGTDENPVGMTGQTSSVSSTPASTDWTSYTKTVTVPAGTTQISIGFSYTPTGTAGANDWFEIAEVQIERGSVATPFEHRSYGDELARCQRYYYKIQAKASAQSGFFGSSFNRNTTTCLGVTFFPVELRTSPTALEQSGTASDYQVLFLTNQVACTSAPAWWESDTFSARTLFTTGASLTAGQGSILRSASTDAYLAWSAEL